MTSRACCSSWANRPQGAEQAAIRAHPAAQHPGRAPGNRATGGHAGTGRGRAAAGGRRRAPRPGRLRRGRGRGWPSGPPTCRGSSGCAAPLRVEKTPEAAVAAAVELIGNGARHVRGAAAPPGQAFPGDFRRAGCHRRPGDPRGVRAAGEPQHPDTEVLIEVDSDEVFVFTGGQPGSWRAAGRDERPRGRADVRRDRLAGRRVPDDAARIALLLPALLRHAADRPGVHLQGVRAGPRARQVPGRSRGCSWCRSARRSRRSRPLRVRTGCRSWRSGG